MLVTFYDRWKKDNEFLFPLHKLFCFMQIVNLKEQPIRRSFQNNINLTKLHHREVDICVCGGCKLWISLH